MYLKNLFIFCMCALAVSHEVKKHERRRGRLFSFNTVDNDITVSLDFTVPFLTIPVKKTFDAFGQESQGLPTINVNPASLALGGALVLGSTILVPFLVKNYANEYPHHRYAKILDNVDFNADTMLGFAYHVLESRSIYGCSLRFACWTGQSSHNGEILRIWSQIMSNHLLSNMVNTTAIAEAMTLGRKGIDCLTYSPCPLHKSHLSILMKNFGLRNKPDLT